jgi:citronellol/citronellal dehydrogenase
MAAYRTVFREGLFSGRIIVVTGGGSGIGRCTAHELAALGARVVLLGRKPERLLAVAAEITADVDNSAAEWHACDIRDEAVVKTTIAAIVSAHGRIDGLVNNAGGQFPAPLSAISQKGFETVVRTNLVGGFLVAREVYNQSMSERGGAIVNIVADMWRSMPGMGHSGAARAGMVNFTQTAAAEWGASGVRVNAVAPGGSPAAASITTRAPPRR